MKAVVFTLGCKVNGSESESLITGLKNLGYETSEKLERADLYIVNTCAVTGEAERKSRQAVARIKKLNASAKIIFTGCAVQKSPESFMSKGVHIITGNFNKGEILSLLNSEGNFVAPENSVYEDLLPPTTDKVRTYVKVQDGCNNFCSYCIIPYLRGRSRSRDYNSIINEIQSLNAKEVVLNGINLSAYDFNCVDLAGLIERLNGVKCRIRLGSLEVGVVTDRLLIALKSLHDFAEHFHLSLQSGSNAVLKKMNRRYTAEEYAEKCSLIRKYFPNVGITTDIIVGFPTETEQDFLDSVNLAKRVEFSDIHCFSFSPRQGTVAYKMKDLPPETKKERLDRLLAVKKDLRQNFIAKNLGLTATVVGEELDGDYTVGYTGNYIRVFIKGDFVGKTVKVTLNQEYQDGCLCSPEIL